jgi:hypothetical protein
VFDLNPSDKLEDKNSLAGGESCSTQNANEAQHHGIWDIASKDISQVKATNLFIFIKFNNRHIL